MTRKLKITAVVFALFCILLTGCTAKSTGEGSGDVTESGSWLPDVGLATITHSETVSCFVSNKQYEELRDRYLITVQAEDGSTLRFRTNKDYYEQTKLEAEGEILVCDISYPIYGTDTLYYINKQQLADVWVTPAEPLEQVSPVVDGFATLVSETTKSVTVTDFAYKSVFNVATKTTQYYYYVYLEMEDGTSFRVDNKDFYNKWTVGDTYDFLVQTIDYPISGTGERYCYNGKVLY